MNQFLPNTTDPVGILTHNPWFDQVLQRADDRHQVLDRRSIHIVYGWIIHSPPAFTDADLIFFMADFN